MPIFLVPGLGGTRLKECNSTRLVWLNAPLYLDCTSKLIKILDVVYDPKEKTFESKNAVKPDREMGDLRAIANISDPPTDICSQFDAMIRYFEKISGYIPGENIFGVPYDWRLILDGEYWAHFTKQLIQLIEKQQDYCPTIKCIFIAMSMGGLVMTKFLSERDSEWKKNHVAKLITIGTPFGGSPRACLSLCGGVEDITGLDNYFIKDLFRNCAGSYMCQPNKNCFPNLKIVRNLKEKDYRVDEIETVFEEEEFDTKTVRTIFRDTYSGVVNLMDNGPGPEVEVHCIVGSSKDTVIAINYAKPKCPRQITEDDYYQENFPEDDCLPPHGDGVVPFCSATYWCNKKYSDGTPYIKTLKVFKGDEYLHSELPKKTEVVQYITTLLDISSIEDLLSKC